MEPATSTQGQRRHQNRHSQDGKGSEKEQETWQAFGERLSLPLPCGEETGAFLPHAKRKRMLGPHNASQA